MQNQSLNKNPPPQKSKTKSKISKRQRNRRKNKKKIASQQNQLQPPHPTTGTGYKRSGVDIWREAYENSIRWHAEHQGNFWRQMALKLEDENEKLKNDLTMIRSSVHCEVYEKEQNTTIQVQHSRTSLKDESDEVDNGYLEFLETTIQHQEETRMTRQLEDSD